MMKREPEIAGAAHKALRAGDRVSQAANRLFYERGIRAVGIEEIVAEAGVTKPSLYRSYPSKDALVGACLEARFDEIMARVAEIEACHAGDPLATVRAMVAAIDDEMSDPAYRGCAITNAAVEFPEPDHPTRVRVLEFKKRKHARLLAIVSRLPTSRPAALADALTLLFEGARAIRHTSCMNGPARSLREAADAVLAGFLDVGDDAAIARRPD